MARAGPRKIGRYGEQFKATAVKLSSLPGVLIQDVAQALDIHPFMLSLWRKQVRDGVIVELGLSSAFVCTSSFALLSPPRNWNWRLCGGIRCDSGTRVAFE